MANKLGISLVFSIILGSSFNASAEKVHWTKHPNAAQLPSFCGASTNPKYAGINWKKIGRDVV